MKIAVLLSGGVDSSVALSLLKQAGYREVHAFYIKIWLEDDLAFLGDCPWEEDLQYARAVCEKFDVPLSVVSLQTEYFEKVVDEALKELRAGRTPSPDILCNQRIKFGEFMHRIGPDFHKVASGHYAQISQQNGVYYLKRSPDPVKDQTYFLSYLNQQQLARALFPIGHLTKKEVRALARKFDLPNKNRKDSQGICFLGKIRYPDFVKFHLGEKIGKIVDLDSGKKLGEHRGYWFYTIGQRQGLGLSGGPWYVVGKDTEKNIIYVSHKLRLREKATHRFVVGDVNWISGIPAKTELLAKVRHGPRLTSCNIAFRRDHRLEVTLAEEDPGIAPGQYCVFYDGEVCLGGGIIQESHA